MKTLKDFTPEIQAKIPAYIDAALKGIFDGGRYNNFDFKKAEAAVDYNYRFCGFDKPMIIVAENIYESQIFFNYIKNNRELLELINIFFILKNEKKTAELSSQLDIQFNARFLSFHKEQFRRQLSCQLDELLEVQLDEQLASRLNGQLNKQLASRLNEQLRFQLKEQLNKRLPLQPYEQSHLQLNEQLNEQFDKQLYKRLSLQLYEQLELQLSGQLDRQLGFRLMAQPLVKPGEQHIPQLKPKHKYRNDYLNDYLFTLDIYSNVLFTLWRFINDEFNLKLTIQNEFDEFEKLYKESNIYSGIFTDKLCIISKYPQKIHRDTNNNLHNVTANAVEWGHSTAETQFDCYYIHGRHIPNEIFRKALDGKLTKQEFINEKNVEIKACYYEILGNDKLMNLLEAEIVDTGTFVHKNGDLETVELYKTKEKIEEIGEKLAWVKFICPSTGANYLISVEPKFETAVEAAISTSPIFNKNDYSFTDRT